MQIDLDALAKTETAPLLEIQLELVAPDIVWKPDLYETPEQDVSAPRTRTRQQAPCAISLLACLKARAPLGRHGCR